MNENRVIQSRWSRLRAAYKAGLPALTVTRAREFLRDHPDCGPAWKILGSALIDLGRHAEAEGALKRAIALCPPDKVWIPLAEMGHLHKARGEFWGAAAWYGQAIKSVPDEAGGHIGLGGILARFGRLRRPREPPHRAAPAMPAGLPPDRWVSPSKQASGSGTSGRLTSAGRSRRESLVVALVAPKTSGQCMPTGEQVTPVRPSDRAAGDPATPSQLLSSSRKVSDPASVTGRKVA